MFIGRSLRRIGILSTILLLILTFNGIGVYGQAMFTDVGKSHWAYEYIGRAVDMGLMDGYEDASFRPSEEVNIADALVYIGRLFNFSKETIEDMRLEYRHILDNLELTEQEKDGLAVAMLKELVTDVYIQNNLFKEGNIRGITKIDLVNYIARAMGAEEKDEKVHVFFYRDAEAIPERSRSYVKYLIDNGILDAKGDGNGNFNPKESVIRSVLAKILSLSHEKIYREPANLPSPPKVEPEDTPSKGKEIRGILIGKLDSFLFIQNGQRKDSYKLKEDSKIYIDSKEVSIDDLNLNMKVRALISEGNLLEELTVDGERDIVYGVISDLSLKGNPYMSLDFAGGEGKTFYIAKDIETWLNGEESYLFSLKEGDRVELEIFGDLALSINAESAEGKVYGLVRDISLTDDEGLVLVERENTTSYEYSISENTLIYKNMNPSSLDRLRPMDEISLFIRDGEVRKIEAISIPGKDQGHIKEILISKKPSLSILNEEEEIKEYSISLEAILEMDGLKKTIYDLRLEDFIELELESNEIVNIEIKKQGRE